MSGPARVSDELGVVSDLGDSQEAPERTTPACEKEDNPGRGGGQPDLNNAIEEFG